MGVPMGRIGYVAALAAFSSVAVAGGQQTSLELKKPVERSLSPRESPHQYVVSVRASQLMIINVEQRGIDVVVTVIGPDGNQLAAFDGATEMEGTGGIETARMALLDGGDYTV